MSAFQTPVSSHVVAFAPRAIDPLGRIVRAYDRAIRACEAFDQDAAKASIGVLRAALELDSPASRGFDALYQWCESAINAHDFIGPARTLRSLREAWCLAGRPAPIVVRSEWPVS
jgi:hypothetical protein